MTALELAEQRAEALEDDLTEIDELLQDYFGNWRELGSMVEVIEDELKRAGRKPLPGVTR